MSDPPPPGQRRLFDDDSPHLDRFGPLLLLTILVVVAMSLIELGPTTDSVRPAVSSTLVSLVIGLTLLLALRAAGLARRWRILADIFVLLAGVVSIFFLVVDLASDADLSAFDTDRPSPVWVAIAAVTPVAVIRRLIQHRRVTAGTMQGAIAAYLLIAVAFAYTALFVSGLDDGAFFVDQVDPPTTSFMYFSLVSITTVGYGDLVPANNFARLLATSEAVLGQIYLVTFVAMLVGLRIQQRDGADR